MSTKPPKLTRSDLESQFQSKIIKFLKSQGCIAWKLEQNATTSASRPDILFLKEGFWGAIEVKKSAKARFQPGQKQMIKKLNEWSWCKAVWPDNFEDIKNELLDLLK